MGVGNNGFEVGRSLVSTNGYSTSPLAPTRRVLSSPYPATLGTHTLSPGYAPPTVVALYCYEYGNAWFPNWSPYDLDLGRGLGGSEEMVIYVSRELANLGFWVEVYAEPKARDVGRDNGYGRDGGGVVWYPYKAYDTSRPPDVFVSWR